jgi:hypothetical protein
MASDIQYQLHINKINIASDILTEIKSYCFYDKKSWETMQFIKSKKNRINHLINIYCISRANPEDFYTYGSDTDENWAFWVFNEEDGNNGQFQGANCSICGEYKHSFMAIPENIRCKCIIQDDVTINTVDDEDDEDGWFSYESDEDESDY